VAENQRVLEKQHKLTRARTTLPDEIFLTLDLQQSAAGVGL